MSKALHCGWGDAHWQGASGPEEGTRGVDKGDVAEHSRSDTVLAVGLGVLEEGGTRIGAFVVVVTGLLIHALFGMFLELCDSEAVEVVGLLGCHGVKFGSCRARLEDVSIAKHTPISPLECPGAGLFWIVAS